MSDDVADKSQMVQSDSPFVASDPAGRLKSIIERIENLEEEKKNIAEDIRDIYLEAKSDGYDVKVLRKLVALRKKDPDKRREEDDILQLYMSTIGMI